jgi:hypothetical protein
VAISKMTKATTNTKKRKATTNTSKPSKRGATTSEVIKNRFLNTAIEFCSLANNHLPLLIPLVPALQDILDRVRKRAEGCSVEEVATDTDTNSIEGNITNTSAAVSATLSKDKEKVRHFLVWTLTNVGKIENACTLFFSQDTIKSHFLAYDRRVVYLLLTEPHDDDLKQKQLDVAGKSTEATRLGRQFTARSLATELENWEINNNEVSVEQFVRTRLCILPPGTQESEEYKNDVKRTIRAVNRGVLGRRLEREAQNAAASIIMAWDPWRFEHYVGAKRIKYLVVALKDQTFQSISEFLLKIKDKINDIQKAVNDRFPENYAATRSKLASAIQHPAHVANFE